MVGIEKMVKEKKKDPEQSLNMDVTDESVTI